MRTQRILVLVVLVTVAVALAWLGTHLLGAPASSSDPNGGDTPVRAHALTVRLQPAPPPEVTFVLRGAEVGSGVSGLRIDDERVAFDTLPPPPRTLHVVLHGVVLPQPVATFTATDLVEGDVVETSVALAGFGRVRFDPGPMALFADERFELISPDRGASCLDEPAFEFCALEVESRSLLLPAGEYLIRTGISQRERWAPQRLVVPADGEVEFSLRKMRPRWAGCRVPPEAIAAHAGMMLTLRDPETGASAPWSLVFRDAATGATARSWGFDSFEIVQGDRTYGPFEAVEQPDALPLVEF